MNLDGQYVIQLRKAPLWFSVLSFVAFVGLIVAASFGWVDTDVHACKSPCTVEFPKGTQEDDFKIDYAHGTLRVTLRERGHE